MEERDGVLNHETTFTDMAGTDGENNDWESADPAAPTPEECLMQKALWEAIVEATKELTPRQQLLFHLKYVEDKSVIEIAETMNLSENAASHAIQRMEERLRKILVQSGVREEPPGFHRAPPPPAGADQCLNPCEIPITMTGPQKIYEFFLADPSYFSESSCYI